MPSDWDSLADAYQMRMQRAVDHWLAGNATDDDAAWLEWMLRKGLLSNKTNNSSALARLVAAYRQTEATISAARVVEGLADMSPGTDYPVLVGGNAGNPGVPAPRRFLKNILGAAAYTTEGSGRRELAEAIASAGNPLTARVMVNRIWHYVFGRGIVSTVDNFGVIGEPPSHPELLDYLAGEFVAQGWSIRKMVRQMVLSTAFQQSSTSSPKARESDPQNSLLHHYPLRRLEAESIRDRLLLSSGTLKPSMFGPSVHPHRDQPKEYRRLFSGSLDGEGRRSLYLKVTRMEGTRFLETFDYPNPMTTRGSRDTTNVPAQSLTLINDPFVHLQAQALANRLLAQPATDLDSRIAALFRAALSRMPRAVETERFRNLAAELASLHGVKRSELLYSTAVWKDLAHTVFNMKEFVYVQ
jgi:hypothetical protein